MKNILAVLILAAIPLALACTLGAQIVPQSKVEQKTMAVPANKNFTNTGFTIGPTDRITITATGTIYFCGPATQSGVGPDGWPRATYMNSWPDDYNECSDPLENIAHASLIADVNNQKFLIGAKQTFSGKNGLLYLGINDCTFTGGNFYNTGKFDVTIKVERNAVPIKK